MGRSDSPRSCQNCTACCDGWLRITIQGQAVYPGKKCPFSTGTGCSDYPNRPIQPCRQFDCGWLIKGSPLPDWMRPDTAKVIVLFNELVFSGIPIDVAVPVGRRIPPRALQWLKYFAERERRVLIYSEQIVANKSFTGEQSIAAFGPPELSRFMPEIIENYISKNM